MLIILQISHGKLRAFKLDLLDKDVIVIENGGRESDQRTLYFDGTVNVSGNEAGVVVISPENK